MHMTTTQPRTPGAPDEAQELGRETLRAVAGYLRTYPTAYHRLHPAMLTAGELTRVLGAFDAQAVADIYTGVLDAHRNHYGSGGCSACSAGAAVDDPVAAAVERLTTRPTMVAEFAEAMRATVGANTRSFSPVSAGQFARHAARMGGRVDELVERVRRLDERLSGAHVELDTCHSNRMSGLDERLTAVETSLHEWRNAVPLWMHQADERASAARVDLADRLTKVEGLGAGLGATVGDLVLDGHQSQRARAELRDRIGAAFELIERLDERLSTVGADQTARQVAHTAHDRIVGLEAKLESLRRQWSADAEVITKALRRTERVEAEQRDAVRRLRELESGYRAMGRLTTSKVRALKLRPGRDAIVIEVADGLDADDAATMAEVVRERLPEGVPVLLFDGARVRVLRNAAPLATSAGGVRIDAGTPDAPAEERAMRHPEYPTGTPRKDPFDEPPF